MIAFHFCHNEAKYKHNTTTALQLCVAVRIEISLRSIPDHVHMSQQHKTITAWCVDLFQCRFRRDEKEDKRKRERRMCISSRCSAGWSAGHGEAGERRRGKKAWNCGGEHSIRRVPILSTIVYRCIRNTRKKYVILYRTDNTMANWSTQQNGNTAHTHLSGEECENDWFSMINTSMFAHVKYELCELVWKQLFTQTKWRKNNIGGTTTHAVHENHILFK